MSDAKPIRIFSDAALTKMQHTRDVLNNKFNPYFSKLKVKYSKDSSAAREIDATLALIGYCINFTSTALGPSSKFIKDENISLFYQRLDELEAQTDYWLQQSKKDAELSSKMGNIEVELGISIDELENMASYVLSSKEQLTQKGKAPTLVSGLARDPRVGGQVSSMASDLSTQLLGPFAGIAGFGKDIFSSLRRQMIGRQQEGWMKGLYGGSTIPGSMKEDIFSSRQSGSSVEGNILNVSMENFFDRKAYTSKWTREVLDSLKKLTGEKPDGKQDIGSKIANSLQAMLPNLIVAAVLAVGGAIAALRGGMKTREGLTNVFGEENSERLFGKPSIGKDTATWAATAMASAAFGTPGINRVSTVGPAGLTPFTGIEAMFAMWNKKMFELVDRVTQKQETERVVTQVYGERDPFGKITGTE